MSNVFFIILHLVFFVCFVFQHRVSVLCIFGCPGIFFVDQAGLGFLRQCLSLNLELINVDRVAGQQALGNPPVSIFSVLGLQPWTSVQLLHDCC